MDGYEDILDTDWPKPTVRTHMPLKQRAKIFLPFAALTGYEQTLDKTKQQQMEEYEEKAGKIQFEQID